MTKLLSTVLAALLLCLSIAVNAAAYDGIVSVDSVEAQPGDHFVADVWLTNNTIDIAGISCPLQFDNSILVADSVSFVGAIESGTVGPVASIEQDKGLIRIAYLPSFPVTSFFVSEGLLAKIHFHLDNNAQPTTSVLDSLNYDSIISIKYSFDTTWFNGQPVVDTTVDTTRIFNRIEIADASGFNVYLPNFIPGAVIVKVPTAVNDPFGSALPNEFALNQNYPNPFNPTTIISFDLPQAGSVRLDIYNVLGQSVQTLANGHFSAGRHEVEFDASAQPSGIYFYRLTHPEGVLTRKMVLIK